MEFQQHSSSHSVPLIHRERVESDATAITHESSASEAKTNERGPTIARMGPENRTLWEQYPPHGRPRVALDEDRYIPEHYSPIEPYVLQHEDEVEIAHPDLKNYTMEWCDHDRDDPYAYRSFFYGREHKNLLGFHPELGSICVSLRKEIVPPQTKSGNSIKGVSYQYRGILRTFEKFSYCLKSEADLGITKQKILGKVSTKEILLSMFPVCESAKLKEVEDPKLAFELLSLEEKTVERNFKFGVIYCKEGQNTEEQMLCNEEGSKDFEEFLSCIGEKVQLKGFKGYRGGLDVKENTTGTESYVSNYKDMNIMFHVSTYLPHSTHNRQQIARKAHIGNDIGIVVFKEAGDEPNPFKSSCIVSQFPHFFIVVEKVKSNIGKTLYRIACTRKDDVPAFGPYNDKLGYFEPNEATRDFILAKCINGENASYHSTKFTSLRQRTRRVLLEDLTKTFLRKASLGSNSSIATWRSQLFGTTDNLNKAGNRDSLTVVDKDKRRSGQMPRPSEPVTPSDFALYRQRSLSFSRRPDETPLEDALSDDARNETESNKTGKGFFNKRALSPQPTSSSISSILSKNLRPMSLAADGPQDQRFEQMLLALKQAEKEKQQEADRVKELRDQVAALKLKLDAKYTDDIAKLTQGNELLKMAVELKETKLKLQKSLAFIESIQYNSSTAIKELSPLQQQSSRE